MGELETKIISNYHLEPFLWLRFIDDIFALWTHGSDELSKFLDYMNTYHDTIKFTMDSSSEKIVFLDTIVKKSKTSNRLLVELYTKPTDTHNYLHFKSFHPSHTKRCGLYSQFLRIRRNCTLLSDYDSHSQMIKSKYIQRGYPESLIENSRIKARNYDRDLLIKPKISSEDNNDNKTNVIPLILTYHPSNQQVHKIIMDNWGILQYSEICRNALPVRPLFATRRNKSLKDVLIRSRLSTSNTVDNYNQGVTCKFPNCLVCSTLKKKKTFQSTITNKTFKIPVNLACTTRNVIYLLTCTVCNKQYVGETKRPFCVRLKEHLADIRLKRNKPIALHFNSHDSSNNSLIPQIIEKIQRDPDDPVTTDIRKKREVFWIYRLKTLIPNGLNFLGQ